jgi:CoA:oxalate CoA-transferase
MRPLDGIKIIDFTQAHAGSLATMHLADFGADVIKIERPRIGDLCRYWPPFKEEKSAYFCFLNRGKRSITIDARSEEGKAIIKNLVRQADVVCENFKVGNLDRLGLGYDTLKEVNPNIIYGSISGFGTSGPLKDLAAYDLMVQSMSGIVDMTGFEDGPPTKAGPAIGDHLSGLYLANAICLALIYRARSGEGQRIDIAILDSLFSILEAAPITWALHQTKPTRSGNKDFAKAPCDTFAAADGYLSIAVTKDDQWQAFCRIIHREDLRSDPNYATNQARLAHYIPELRTVIREAVRGRICADLMSACRAVGIACAKVLSIREAVGLDRFRQRSMLVDVHDNEIGTIRMPGIAIKLSLTPGRIESSAPALGSHADQILSESGYSAEDIGRFHSEGII